MILDLFDAQIVRLAAAVARRRGTDPETEIVSMKTLVATIEGSVVGLIEAAGMRPEAAEVVARAYAAGWIDGAHRWTGSTLADLIHDRMHALEEPTPRRVGVSVALAMPGDQLGRVPGVVDIEDVDAA